MPDDDGRPKFCPRCGHEAPAHGDFCPECGADILAEATGVSATGPGVDGEQKPVAGPPRPPVQPREQPDKGGAWSTRRKLLVGVGGGVLAAAVGGSFLSGFMEGASEPQHDIDGEAWDLERTETQSSVQLSGMVTLPEGRYATRSTTPQTTVDYEIEFDVRQDEPIDVLLMPEDEYDDRYRDAKDEFEYLIDLSVMDSTGTALTGQVNASDYRLVIDNTGVYGAEPEGEVDIQFSLIASL